MANNKKEHLSSDAMSRIGFLSQACQLVTLTNPEATEVTRLMVQSMKTVSRRTNIRLSHHTKRLMCKKCNNYLFPGVSSSVRVRSQRSKHTVVTCNFCGTMKRFLLDDKYSLWNDRPEALEAVKDYAALQRGDKIPHMKSDNTKRTVKVRTTIKKTYSLAVPKPGENPIRRTFDIYSGMNELAMQDSLDMGDDDTLMREMEISSEDEAETKAEAAASLASASEARPSTPLSSSKTEDKPAASESNLSVIGGDHDRSSTPVQDEVKPGTETAATAGASSSAAVASVDKPRDKKETKAAAKEDLEEGETDDEQPDPYGDYADYAHYFDQGEDTADSPSTDRAQGPADGSRDEPGGNMGPQQSFSAGSQGGMEHPQWEGQQNYHWRGGSGYQQGYYQGDYPMGQGMQGGFRGRGGGSYQNHQGNHRGKNYQQHQMQNYQKYPPGGSGNYQQNYQGSFNPQDAGYGNSQYFGGGGNGHYQHMGNGGSKSPSLSNTDSNPPLPPEPSENPPPLPSEPAPSSPLPREPDSMDSSDAHAEQKRRLPRPPKPLPPADFQTFLSRLPYMKLSFQQPGSPAGGTTPPPSGNQKR